MVINRMRMLANRTDKFDRSDGALVAIERLPFPGILGERAPGLGDEDVF